MIDWQEFSAPPKEIPDTMRDMSRVLYSRRQTRSNGVFEKILDVQDKYYFSTSEAHNLDRRNK